MEWKRGRRPDNKTTAGMDAREDLVLMYCIPGCPSTLCVWRLGGRYASANRRRSKSSRGKSNLRKLKHSTLFIANFHLPAQAGIYTKSKQSVILPITDHEKSCHSPAQTQSQTDGDTDVGSGRKGRSRFLQERQAGNSASARHRDRNAIRDLPRGPQ